MKHLPSLARLRLEPTGAACSSLRLEPCCQCAILTPLSCLEKDVPYFCAQCMKVVQTLSMCAPQSLSDPADGMNDMERF